MVRLFDQCDVLPTAAHAANDVDQVPIAASEAATTASSGPATSMT